MKLREKPFAAVAAVFGSVYALLQLPLLNSIGVALWTSAQPLFTVVTIGALTLPPHWPPSSNVDWAVLLVAGLMIAKVGQIIWSNFDREIRFI
ncbi:hypothetical protein DVK02_12885 [Halobellus sp. Atlit-31R]|nr:hypothetical protein DVK02_12885 [Halobellus sp. Atlit-31R]